MLYSFRITHLVWVFSMFSHEVEFFKIFKPHCDVPCPHRHSKHIKIDIIIHKDIQKLYYM